MADQNKPMDQDERDDATEDTEGHGLMGERRPPESGNPTGDDTPASDEDSEGIIPKRIIPKR